MKMKLFTNFLADEIEGVEIRGEALFSLCIKFLGNNTLTILPAAYNKPCAVAISSNKTIFRTLTLPKVSSKELPSLIRSALESALSISIDEYEITWKKRNGQISCFLTPKAELQKIYEELHSHALKTTWLFPKSLCLVEALEYLTKDKLLDVIFLDIDERESTCILIHNGLTYDVKTVDGIQEVESVESWKPLREIARILLAWHEKYPQTQTNPLLITGPLSDDDKTVITNFLKKEPYTLPKTDLTTSEYSVLEHLPALGAALISHNVDILKKQCGYQVETCAEVETRQWIPTLSALTILILLIAFGVYGIGQGFLKTKESELKAHFQKLVALTYQEVPPGFVQDPENLSDLELSLEQVENQLKAKDLYPITADIPQMGELLIWLSDQAEKASKEADATSIELTLLQYTLAKRPDKTRSKDRYQVRVDIEFTAGGATQARKFHEELLAPNDFIDPKQEVKWSLGGGKWRTSFVLKDKTLYFP